VVVWGVTVCFLVDKYQYFRRACCISCQLLALGSLLFMLKTKFVWIYTWEGVRSRYTALNTMKPALNSVNDSGLKPVGTDLVPAGRLV
jgi:hypothetical protein